jgi:uncharacterized protein (TIGR02300 family)
MSTATLAAPNKARGHKLKCQSSECGLSFYDLNREAFACPNCGTIYDLQAAADAQAALEAKMSQRKGGRYFSQQAPVAKAVEPTDPNDVDNDKEESLEDVDAEMSTESGAVIVDDDSVLEEDTAADEIIEVDSEANPRLDE